MSACYTEKEAQTIRAFVRARKQLRQRELATRLETARRDFAAVAAMIAREYSPIRIYQWGSLLEERHFSEISDIDMALEGITAESVLSAIRGQAQKLTRFPLDIVAIEHVHPAYAAYIRRRGRIIYER